MPFLQSENIKENAFNGIVQMKDHVTSRTTPSP